MNDFNPLYVPALRAKQAEWLALKNLSEPVQDRIVPLIDFAPRDSTGQVTEASFERAATCLAEARGDRPIWFDLAGVNIAIGGSAPIQALFDMMPAEARFMPTIRLTSPAELVGQIEYARGVSLPYVALRVLIGELGRDPMRRIDEALARFELDPAEVDLILDLGPTPTPIEPAVVVYSELARQLQAHAGWRSFTLLSGAFPQDLTGLSLGEHHLVRHDLALWAEVTADQEGIVFGDYGIKHPVEEVTTDLRIPSASTRYTVDPAWFVCRGRSLTTEPDPRRTPPPPGEFGSDQYRAHARRIIVHPAFPGANFSAGDRRIHRVATDLTVGNGNAQSWLSDGFNHHITWTVDQLASRRLPAT